MKRLQKATALALIFTAFGMAGSAMAASYRGAQIRRVPHLTRHIGRSYDARKPGRGTCVRWSSNPVERRTLTTICRPPRRTHRLPGRQWHGRSQMR